MTWNPDEGLEDPENSGIKYQHGDLFGYEVREYLLEKWGRTCAYCGKTDIPLEIEHIVPKSKAFKPAILSKQLLPPAKKMGHILDVLQSKRTDHLTLKQRKRRYRALAGDTVAYFIHPMVTRITRHAKAMFPPSLKDWVSILRGYFYEKRRLFNRHYHFGYASPWQLCRGDSSGC